MRRNPAMVDPVGWAKRQAATPAPIDEGNTASSLDPAEACTEYYYAPVAQIIDEYPTVWETATIQPGDTEAQALFEAINATLNNNTYLIGDLPHGTRNGNFSGVVTPAGNPYCWWAWNKCDTPNPATGLEPDITTVPEPDTFVVAFDDGPNCSSTSFYDFLVENNQKATMFMIGSNVADWPIQALRAVADGHEIAVHTWSHPYMTALTNEEAFAELYYARKIIQEILGMTPLKWRPPYGDIDNRIRMIAQLLNLTSVLWDHDTDDWQEGVPGANVTAADVSANYQAVIDMAQNGTFSEYGTITLMHMIDNFTMSEFMAEYANLTAVFKHMVPLCSALNQTNPYVETNYTCPPFETYITGQTNISISSSAPAPSGSSTAASSSSTASSASPVSSAGSNGSSTPKKSAARRELEVVRAGILGLVMLGVAAAVLL